MGMINRAHKLISTHRLKEILQHEQEFGEGQDVQPLSNEELQILVDYYDAVADLVLCDPQYRVIGQHAALRSHEHSSTLSYRRMKI